MATWSEISLSQIGRYLTLASDYYSEANMAAVQIIKQIKSARPLQIVCHSSKPITYGVLKPREVTESNFKLARIQNSESYFIDSADLPSISGDQFEEYERSEIGEYDIVVAVGGYIGPIAILSKKRGYRININRHLARVSPDKAKIDPHYLLGYLSSSLSRTLLMREVRGAVQAGVNIADLKLHPVILPETATQYEIGNIVRTAETKLLESKSLYTTAVKLLEAELGLDNFQFERPLSYEARLSELAIAGRTDAQHYRPRFQTLERQIRKYDASCVRSIRVYNRRGVQPAYVEKGEIDVINSQHIGRRHLDYENFERTNRRSYLASPEAHIKPNDLLIYTTGAYIGSTNVYLGSNPALASNHVNILRFAEGIDAAYMALVFQSVVGQFQTEKHARGSAQAELYPSDIDKFIVPLIDESIQKTIGDLVRDSLAKKTESKLLLEQAKTMVEKLIQEAVQ